MSPVEMIDKFESYPLRIMKNNRVTYAKGERVYDYVFANAICFGGMSLRYNAHIKIAGHTFIEYGSSALEARTKLANELSKSSYVRAQLKQLQ